MKRVLSIVRERSADQYVLRAGLISGLLLVVSAGCLPEPINQSTPTQGLTTQQIVELPGSNKPPVDFASAVRYSIPESPRVDTGMVDLLGHPVTVSCASCHSNFPPNEGTNSADQLVEFHQGLHYLHGAPENSMSCITCHHAENYNYLRLVDGRPIEFSQSRQMCAQCHSKQDRDYQYGAHGGMAGYWDLSRGEQFRKTCIDCHDPHAPQFPAMVPQFKPFDRFLDEKDSSSHD